MYRQFSSLDLYVLASFLFYAGPKLLGGAAFDHMLAAFQKAVKSKITVSLRDPVVAAQATNWHKLPEALGPLAAFASHKLQEPSNISLLTSIGRA